MIKNDLRRKNAEKKIQTAHFSQGAESQRLGLGIASNPTPPYSIFPRPSRKLSSPPSYGMAVIGHFILSVPTNVLYFADFSRNWGKKSGA